MHVFYEKFYKNTRTFFSYIIFTSTEAATGGALYEKVFLEISQNSQENICARVSFLIQLQAWGEFCEISKNTFFTEYLWATAFTSTLSFSSAELMR